MKLLLFPTKTKLAFMIPWVLYLALELVLGNYIFLPAAGLTLAFLWILGGMVDYFFARNKQMGSTKLLLGGALALAGLDHLSKLAVLTWLPPGSTVPLIPGAYSLQQVLNMEAAWLPNKFGLSIPIVVLSIAAVLIMLTTLAVYNYYTGVHRRNILTDLGMLLIIAGSVSALGDQVFRGFTVDYITFQGFFTADLKDIYLTLGWAVVIAEALYSPVPEPPLRALPGLVKGIIKYNIKGGSSRPD